MAKKTATLTLEDTPAEPLIQKGEEGAEEKPALNLMTKIKTKDGEFTVQELLEARINQDTMKTELAQLNEYRQHVATLSNPAVEDQNVRARSLRYVLSADGVPPEVIEQQVQSVIFGNLAGESEGADEGQGQQAWTREEAKPTQDPTMMANFQALQDELKQTRLGLLKRELGSNVGRVLDSDPEMSKLVKKVKEIRGDSSDAAIKVLREDIEDRTIKNLQKRVALTGQRLNDEWISEEVGKAAKEVYQRSLFGDPDALRKAPAPTEAGGDMFANRKPVPAPDYKKGDSMASVEQKIGNYGTDVLARLASELGTGATKA